MLAGEVNLPLGRAVEGVPYPSPVLNAGAWADLRHARHSVLRNQIKRMGAGSVAMLWQVAEGFDVPISEFDLFRLFINSVQR